jgi:hypothetical protein
MGMVGRLGGVFSVCTLAGLAAIVTLGGETVGLVTVGILGRSTFCVVTLVGIVGILMAGGVLIRLNIAASFVVDAIVFMDAIVVV